MKIKLMKTLTAVILFLTPNLNFGQAPALGTASDFVLFSSVGAVTNVGTQYLTLLTGHIGANSGPITNFGNVDGNLYPGGPQSAACAADLTIAYNQLNATVATIFPAPLLGNGQTLTPGVHSIAGATTLNLDLTLDGLGNPNAVFVFKIQGPLSTNANSKVKLINGTKACNVFWKVEGLVDMATGTTMRGTVIANNAAINMTAGDTLEGRALSTNGAVTVSGIFGYTPIGCGSPVLVGPLAPNLASTDCYALFSSIGPVTNNVDPTFARGDVGTNSGLTTGFNPLFVTGAIHPVPDGSTSLCATDLNIVYNYLLALPADVILIAPALFGHNLVLTPHTYLLSGATALTDTVYLDAQGSPNAVFVIKIDGAFMTSTNSRIILRNGAQPKNVFWKIDGAVDINGNSIFNGSIITAGAINLQSGVLINGRALTINGALNTSAVTVNIPLGSCGFNSPLIITEPSPKTVCEGDSVSFVVSAIGVNVTYQWRKGNVNLANGGDISGVNTATLTINPASTADAATNYNVIVDGDFAPSDTSINVSLTVNTAPIITSQPTNQSACVGGLVSFSVAATGTGLTYQWRKGIVNLVNGGNISGATSATLAINPVGAGDAATNYNVIVSGACAPSATSTNVSLIIGGTVIITEPTDQASCVGDIASFSVSATGTGLFYQWRIGTVNLVNGLNISGATSATLTINPVGAGDAATNYNVVVTGACAPSATSTNVSLIIGGAIIITQPINKVVCEGSSVSFSVTASGSGLSYQWRKGIVNVGTNSATLTINPVSLSDAGTNYNVIVTGTCAPSATSTNVSLIVNPATGPTNFTTGATTICQNANNETYNATAANSTSITYSVIPSTAGIINSTTGVMNWNNSFSGTATITAKANGTCGTTNATRVVTINPSTGIIILSGTLTVCQNAPDVTYTATAANSTSITFSVLPSAAGVINSTTGVMDWDIAFSGTATITAIATGSCGTTSATKVITVRPLPVAVANSNSPVCVGSSINFTAQTVSGATYGWSGPNGYSSPAQNPVILSASLTDAGTYSLSVSNTCGTASSTEVVVINPSTGIVILSGTLTVCQNAPDVTYTATAANSTSITFSVLPSAAGVINSITGVMDWDIAFSGTATITAIATGSCGTTSATKVITVSPLPVAIANSNSPVCAGSSISFTAQTVLGATYGWTGPNGYSSPSQNPVILSASLTDAGTYSLSVSNSCGSASSTEVVVVNNCSADLSVIKTVNNSTPIIGNTVVFTITATNNGINNATGVEVNDVLQSGYVYVSSSVTTGIFNPSTGVWTIGNMNNGTSQVLTVTVTVIADGNYVNTAIIYGNEPDLNMANNNSSIETYPTDFFIPEGFSPNGDGINDLFVIRGILNFSDNKFEIFNRWGNKVFEASPYKSTWDGKATSGIRVGGDELPVGTYFYILDLGDGSDIYKGTIYLNR